MEIQTFRAKTLREALVQVRRQLGPEAAVLHTREVSRGLMGRLFGGRQFEVSASNEIHVPSRLPVECDSSHPLDEQPARPAHVDCDYRSRYRHDFRHRLSNQLGELQSLVEELCSNASTSKRNELPEGMFRVFTDMIEAEIDDAIARDYLDRARANNVSGEPMDPLLVKSRIVQLLEDELRTTGPIRTGTDGCRVIAMVGPTGVGKTTTIAKLAANFRLREKKRVGLITVDTYRVAAVEQLRTYADIIDLPMEVVATPREMREAVTRLSDLDLVLMDTAGRSPRDEVRIQELKSMLGEAGAAEVHLVLSSTASAKSLLGTVERFAEVGATAMLLTKLDEATSLGHLLPVVRNSLLPLSYLTDGQDVPDDIQVAQPRKLAQLIMAMSCE
ncbi:MAG: flagellar biosynthesis protein FlhF [Pirellulales bacterium]